MEKDFFNLTGKILIASPYTMDGNIFHQSLIYVIYHGSDGSTGFIFNRLINNPVGRIFKDIEKEIKDLKLGLHIGGHMELERGFFLHSSEYTKNVLFHLDGANLAISSNNDILKDIEKNKGPKHKMFVMGYTAWGAGEMESEIENNYWIVSEADENLIFNVPDHEKWSAAIANLGINRGEFAPPFIAHS